MKRLVLFCALVLGLLHASSLPAASTNGLRVATFCVDATPPVGSLMAYDPVKKLDDLRLTCRGIVLLGAGEPVVLCSVDWIGIANGGQDAFREAFAQAAGTRKSRVAVHTIHQHDAPCCDFTVEKLLQEAGEDPGRWDGTFAREVIRRAAAAIREAVPTAEPVTHVGSGEAEVKEVASNRRILGPDGKVRATRYTTTRDPVLRAEPEGVIDPMVSMLSFWNGDRPVAVLSFYACHPQSYYRTCLPSPDFPGIARFLRNQAVPEALHVHFNGAGGNLGPGKYNDGNKENRVLLAQRLADGMVRAWKTTQKTAVTPADLRWNTEPVLFALPAYLDEEALRKVIPVEKATKFLGAPTRLAWVQRIKAKQPVEVGCLQAAGVRALFMPGELLVEYQLAARKMRPDLHVFMAAYGEYGPAYVGTAAHYQEGGYEASPDASNVGPEAEALLMGAMKKLLEVKN